jgi:hypothetical protein
MGYAVLLVLGWDPIEALKRSREPETSPCASLAERPRAALSGETAFTLDSLSTAGFTNRRPQGKSW